MVTVVIVVNAATSKMNHQMQPDLSTMVTMTIRMVLAYGGWSLLWVWTCSLVSSGIDYPA